MASILSLGDGIIRTGAGPAEFSGNSLLSPLLLFFRVTPLTPRRPLRRLDLLDDAGLLLPGCRGDNRDGGDVPVRLGAHG